MFWQATIREDSLTTGVDNERKLVYVGGAPLPPKMAA
jgi:hypothetical protein